MIRSAILSIIAHAMVLWGVMEIIPEYLEISGGLVAFLIPALFLGVLNSLVKPLVKLISLPFIVLTAGLFSVVINAAILYVLEYAVNLFKIGDMVFDVKGGFLSYVIVAFVLAVMTEIAHWLIRK